MRPPRAFQRRRGYSEKKKPIPFPVPMEDMYELGRHYPQQDIRARFYILYVYGARISEGLSVRAGDLEIQEKDGREALIATIKTEKNRSMPFRILPCYLDGIEKPMVKYILNYIEPLKRNTALFEVSRQVACNTLRTQTINVKAVQMQPETKIIELPNFRVHPHYLRHCRASHGVSYYGWREAELMIFMGWTSTDQASVYVQLDYSDLLKTMEVRR